MIASPAYLKTLSRVALVLFLVFAGQNGFAGQPPLNLEIQRREGAQSITVNEMVFHTTANEVVNLRLVQVSGSTAWVALWDERPGAGNDLPYYAISLDGQSVSTVKQTSYDILLRYSRFDPATREPVVPSGLTATPSGNVYIVQFVTQPLEEYRRQIAALGGQIFKYMPNHAYLVKMSAESRDKVDDLPFVRWVGHYETVYKLEEFLFEEFVAARLTPNQPSAPSRYNIQLMDRGAELQTGVVQRIQAVGGKVDATDPQSILIEATLTPEQLMQVAQADPVLFIDRWTPGETDMDIVRQIGGGLLLDTYGVSGAGVRGEV
ncbi:MAG: hypothetical protein ACRD1T_27705, partial [Acidimicrobiia bacterium]